MKYAAKRIEIFRELLRKEEETLIKIRSELALAQTHRLHSGLIRILDMPDKDVKEYEL